MLDLDNGEELLVRGHIEVNTYIITDCLYCTLLNHFRNTQE